MKQVADEWKQPFQKEYTESSVTQAFEKLLAFRNDVEQAMEKAGLKSISDRLRNGNLHAATSSRDHPSRDREAGRFSDA